MIMVNPFRFLLALLTAFVASAQNTSSASCTICEASETLSKPDNILAFLPGEFSAMTCGSVQGLLEEGGAGSTGICQGLDQYANFVDIGAFCGCTDSTPPTVCTICDSITNVDLEFEVSLVGRNFTCQEGVEFIPFLSNTMACNGFRNTFDSVCCAAPAPIASPTASAPTAPGASPTASPPTAASTSCTICEAGETLNNPDNVLTFLPGEFSGMTCETAEAVLQQGDAVASGICQGLEAYASFIDVGALCGCGDSTPPNRCTVCTTLINPDIVFQVPLLGSNFTCQDGVNFAPFLSNRVACSGFLSAFKPVCCEDSAPSPTAPSPTAPSPPSPIAAPTAPSPTAPTTPSSAGPPVAAPVAAPTAPSPTAADVPSPAPAGEAPQPTPPTTTKPTSQSGSYTYYASSRMGSMDAVILIITTVVLAAGGVLLLG